MNNLPFYKRPWLYIAGWLSVLLGVYLWQVSRMGGIAINIVRILFDLACIFPLLLLLWMAFFSQFILPVRTFTDRQKIFNRLISRLFGSFGPAIFIRNGVLIKRDGEEQRKGPGVLWLDSASGAVTRTAVKIKQIMGPGVHFIENQEYIAGIIDLHIQTHSLGPAEKDKPFENKKEGHSEEEYQQIQERRKLVSAWTRDGIEVVPNISVQFRVDTGFPQEGQPGSRFGYRTGITPIDRRNEKEDQGAIYKAILGEGINPGKNPESPRHRVAWNQLPILLAVDIWREYVSKFTLDELFTPCRDIPPSKLTPSQPTEEEFDELSQPIHVRRGNDSGQSAMGTILHQFNLFMGNITNRLEGKNGSKLSTPLDSYSPPEPEKKSRPRSMTGWQIINDMVKARLTQPTVDFLDETAHLDNRHDPVPSSEFELLNNRGLKVINAGISNPQFEEKIEKEVIKKWEASWLANAKSESERISRHRDVVENTAKDMAIRQYADMLSREINDLMKIGRPDIKATLKSLVLRSRSNIQINDLLRRHMATELQEIEDIIKWIEINGS